MRFAHYWSDYLEAVENARRLRSEAATIRLEMAVAVRRIKAGTAEVRRRCALALVNDCRSGNSRRG